MKKCWKCPKIGHFSFLSQQKANQNLNSDILGLKTKLHFFNNLQLKNISRELNYDVIIEKTEEGILCRENRQQKEPRGCEKTSTKNRGYTAPFLYL